MDTIIDNNRFIFTSGNARLSFCRVGKNAWRIQSFRNNCFDDIGAAQTLSADLGETVKEEITDIAVKKVGKRYIISSPEDPSAVAVDDGVVSFTLNNGETAFVKNFGDDGKDSQVTVSLAENERVYGCGERFNRVDQRGKIVNIMAIDRWLETEGNSYVPIPFVMTSRCCGFLMNRYEHSIFDIGSTYKGEMVITQYDAPIDLYVFTGENPAEILFSYSRLTGFAPEPAEWMYGIQVCRYAPDFFTIDGVYEMADRMAENDFPWDAVIIEGWPTYKTERYAELKEMTDRLHSMGKKVLLYSTAGKLPSNSAELGMKERYSLMNGETGKRILPDSSSYNPGDNPDGKNAEYLDITDKNAVGWWFGDVWGKLINYIGADGSKIDFCEQFPDFVPVMFADGRNVKGAHHWYPTLYNCLMYRLFSSKDRGGMCFSRGGGIGAQRYPFLWAGDQLREYGFLSAQLKAVLSSGISGIPFMSYDMAGYRPAVNGDSEERVFLRGLEFTAFSANIQTHGKVTRPYDFDEHTKDCYRAYSKLHEELRPYITEQGRISSATGMPLMRHLFLYDCHDENVYDIEDEYMFGSSLLVCPELSGGIKRDIYLPKGEWRDIFTGKVYNGKKRLCDYDVPPEMIPVFLLHGGDSETICTALDKCCQEIECIRRLSGHASK